MSSNVASDAFNDIESYEKIVRAGVDAKRNKESLQRQLTARAFLDFRLASKEDYLDRSLSSQTLDLSVEDAFKKRLPAFLPGFVKTAVYNIADAGTLIPSSVYDDVQTSRDEVKKFRDVSMDQARVAGIPSEAKRSEELLTAFHESGIQAEMSASEREKVKDWNTDILNYHTLRVDEESRFANGLTSHQEATKRDFVRFRVFAEDLNSGLAEYRDLSGTPRDTFFGVFEKSHLNSRQSDVLTPDRSSALRESYAVVRPMGLNAKVAVPIRGFEEIESTNIADVTLRFTPVGESFYISNPEEQIADETSLKPGLSEALIVRIEEFSLRDRPVGVRAQERSSVQERRRGQDDAEYQNPSRS